MRNAVFWSISGASWFLVIGVSWAVLEHRNGLPVPIAFGRAAYFVLIPAFLAACTAVLLCRARPMLQWICSSLVAVLATAGLAWIFDTANDLGFFGYADFAWIIYGLPIVAVAGGASVVDNVNRTYR